jgi:hypothetical protein
MGDEVFRPRRLAGAAELVLRVVLEETEHVLAERRG